MYDIDNNNNNNIRLNLKYKKYNNHDLNWDSYSREVFDSIELKQEQLSEADIIFYMEEKKVSEMNPFKEENKENEYEENIDKNLNNYASTLESQFIESWDNFKLKELQRVAEYYEIPYKGKTKNKLIEKIIEFEEKEENCMKVYNRELKWNTMNELCKDKFFNKFIINWDN